MRFSFLNTCFVGIDIYVEHNFYPELLLMPVASVLGIEKSVEETILHEAAKLLKPWSIET